MNTRIDGASCQIIPDDLYTSGEPSLNRLAAAAGDRKSTRLNSSHQI